MKFVQQFNQVIRHKKVEKLINLLLSEGAGKSHFINYFGVNYNKTNVVSVKLYFSFLHKPSDLFMANFGVDEKYKKLIYSNWESSNSYDFMHQGLTFGLKCYLKDDEVIINKYIHFRTSNFVFGKPEIINLLDEDIKQPGICLEFHGDKVEEKKYFYIISKKNKIEIIKDFGLENLIALDDLNVIEYTESGFERKINLGINNTNAVKEVLVKENNQQLLELCAYFYEKFKLYYFAPGYRYKSNTKAIYFVPKEVYYENFPMQTINLVIK